MKTVTLIKSAKPLTNAETGEFLARLKGQFADGLVLLDPRLDYLGTLVLPEPLAAVEFAPAPMEAGNGSPFTIVRRSRSAASLTEIKAAIKSGHGRDVIRPFDELEFTLDTGEVVTAVCGGYVSDTRARFAFKDCLAEPGQMNEDATNEGGYYKSKARKHILEDVYPHLPPELREIIEPRPLVEAISGETVEYADPLWMPSATDVFGPADNESWWATEPDSVQLEIFRRERDRVKEREGYGTTPYWLRSPLASYSDGFVCVGTGGTVGNASARRSLGFAPGFDLYGIEKPPRLNAGEVSHKEGEI